MVEITISDYNLFLSLLEGEIRDLRMRYNDLQATINNINDPILKYEYKGSLTIEEIKDLQESFKNRQTKLFLKWRELCNNRTPEGIREINSYIIVGWRNIINQ